MASISGNGMLGGSVVPESTAESFAVCGSRAVRMCVCVCALCVCLLCVCSACARGGGHRLLKDNMCFFL